MRESDIASAERSSRDVTFTSTWIVNLKERADEMGRLQNFKGLTEFTPETRANNGINEQSCRSLHCRPGRPSGHASSASSAHAAIFFGVLSFFSPFPLLLPVVFHYSGFPRQSKQLRGRREREHHAMRAREPSRSVRFIQPGNERRNGQQASEGSIAREFEKGAQNVSLEVGRWKLSFPFKRCCTRGWSSRHSKVV